MNNNYIIDDGVEEFTISNKRGEIVSSFAFNPADTGILTRYEAVVDFINGYKLDGVTDEEIEKAIVALDNDLIAQFKYLLNREDAGEGAFKTYKPCTVMANGDFFFETVLEIYGQIIEEKIGERSKKRLNKISKYTRKYHK